MTRLVLIVIVKMHILSCWRTKEGLKRRFRRKE